MRLFAVKFFAKVDETVLGLVLVQYTVEESLAKKYHSDDLMNLRRFVANIPPVALFPCHDAFW
jgi:phospholipid N-methyltransferase